MEYKTYEIGYAYKDGMKFCEVVAIDLDAALADCEQAGLEVITATQK